MVVRVSGVAVGFTYIDSRLRAGWKKGLSPQYYQALECGAIPGGDGIIKSAFTPLSRFTTFRGIPNDSSKHAYDSVNFHAVCSSYYPPIREECLSLVGRLGKHMIRG
jgi:hypothetical protein